MKKSLLFRFVTLYSVVSIILQSFLPFLYIFPKAVSAQDVTPTEIITPTSEPTLIPTTEPTLIPTSEPTAVPTIEPIPTLVPTSTETITPTPTTTIQVTPDVTLTEIPTPTQGEILEGISTTPTSLTEVRKTPDFLKYAKNQVKKEYVEGEVIVKFKKNKLDVKSLFGKAQTFVFEKRFALSKLDEIKNFNIQIFKSKKTTEQIISELKSDQNVEYVEPNYKRTPASISTNDTSNDLLWGLDNTGQTVLGDYPVHTGTLDKDIDAPEAWNVSEGSSSIIVAVIDSGVAYNHPDLTSNMWDGTSCKDELGNPLGGCNHGYDFESNDKTPLPETSSHGTHVAGTISASKNNGKGIIGVSPKAKIMALKTGYYVSAGVKAIDFAIQNGAKIINASYGGNSYSQTEYDAINRFKSAGGIFVAAAGNDTSNNDNIHFYPSDYTLDNIISVAGTDQNDGIYSYSNYGTTSVDVGAPGTNIFSTIPSSNEVVYETFNGLTVPDVPSGWTKSTILNTNKWGTYDFMDGYWDKILYGQVPSFPYDGNANTAITSSTYNLTSGGANIDFWAACDTEYITNGWADYMQLEYSPDGTNFTPAIDPYTGEEFRWDEATFDIQNGDAIDGSGSSIYHYTNVPIPSQYLTSNFKFRFRWVTNSSDNNYDGCLVDDVKVTKLSDGADEKYDYKSGTSMATPHVAGLAALIEGYNPNLTSTQVKNIILSTGDSVSSLSGKTVSGKRINAYNALLAVQQNSQKTITSFTIPSQVGETVINESAHTIGLTMSFGTNVTALIPTIIYTGSSISPASGVAGNFTSPKTYTVTAADSSTQAYSVTVSLTEDPVAAAFDVISANLAASPNFVANNLNNVTSANVSSFAGLSFEKSISGIPVGKLAFSAALNLSSTETQTFLQNLGTKLEQGNGRIALDARESAVFSATGASLTMYGFTGDIAQSQLIVRDDTDVVLNQTGLISSFAQDPTTHNITFDTAHFTQFDIDITKPVIASHTNIGPIEATSASGAIATYTSPSATDNIDATAPAICSPLSGTTFALGQTTITCNKTDTAGNSAVPTTFTVTVVDSTKPVIAAHTNIATLATSPSGASVSYTSPLATDNVDTTSAASCTPASGSTFPIGVTTVTCTKTDAAGNSAISTTFTVTVNKNPPVLDAIGNKTVNELANLTFTAHATDVDSTPIYSLTNAPTGATIDSSTGVFSFTPTEAQGPEIYTLTVSASDDTSTDSEIITITVNEVNVAPVANDITTSTNEDTTKAITLTSIDTDFPANTLSYIKVTNPSHGTVSITGNQATYSPTANYNGSDSFTYKSNDGLADSAPATVTITVNEANDTPAITSVAPTSAVEDTLYTYDASVSDVDGPSATWSVTSSDTCGGVITSDTGIYTFTPVGPLPQASCVIGIKVTDSGTPNLSATQTSTIFITAVNDLPVSVANSYSTNEDTTLNIAAPGVLTNDSDPDNVNITAVLVSDVSYGTLTLNSNGSFSYAPVANYNGIDSFTYKANDGTADSSAATVTITVSPVNDAPIALANSYTTNEDTVLTIHYSSFLDNDSDIDGDTLTVSAVSNPIHGTVVNANTESKVIFTPEANYNGPASFDYTITDGTLTSTATVTITYNSVNDAPILAAVGNKSIDEFATLTTTISASDVDNTDLTYTTSALPANATFNASTRTLSFTPVESQGGSTYTITFTVTDGDLSDSETISILVNEVNSAPVAVNDSASVNEDGELTTNATTLLSNDYDLDTNTNAGLTITAVNSAVNGTVSLTGSTITFTPNANFYGSASFKYVVSDGSLTDTGNVAVTVNGVNDSPVLDSIGNKNVDEFSTLSIIAHATDVDNGTLIYTTSGLPTNASFNSTTKTFTFTPNESQGGSIYDVTFTASDGTLTDSETITISVNEVNNAPVATADTATMNEDSVLTINTSTLLSNDIDLDTNTNIGLSISAVNTPVNGAVNISGNTITFTPNTNFNGTASFNYIVTDGSLTDTGSVSITVNAVNDKPVASAGSITTAEDTAVEITPSGTDVDGDSLTYAIVSTVSHGTLGDVIGNKVTYTPTLNYNGPASFTFKTNDGALDSDPATVSITVTPVNDAPILDIIGDKSVNELTNLSFTAQATDPDSSVAYSLTNAPTGATIGGSTGVFNFTPTEAQGPGSYTLTVNATDGTSTDSEEITITVLEVNTAPVANDISTSTNEDVAKIITLTSTDSDLPANTITYSKVTDPIHGTVSISGTQATYTPNADYNGSDSFTYRANDGTANSNTATVTITINAVNDAPVATADSYTTNEDTVLSISKTSLLTNDSDIDGNAITVSAVSGAVHGAVVINGANIEFTPTQNYSGTASFIYTISDGTLTDTATVTITINAVNDAPISTAGSVTTLEDTPVEITLAATDVDEDSLTYSIVSTVSHGTLGDVVGNKVTYTPTLNYNGPASFTFKANDGTLNSNISTISIAVTAVNDSPVLSSISNKSVNELTNLTFTASAIDPDNTVTYSLTNAPVGATIDNATGVFSFTPTEAQGPGTYNVTVSATDGTSTDSEEITITVNEVNTPPIVQAVDVTTAEDTIKVITLSGTDSDIPANTLSYSKVADPVHGTVTITGNKATYSPTTNYNGSDSFTYRANDGTANSNISTVTITVDAVNDSPVAVANSYTTNEDTVLNIDNTSLLANDTDIDGDTLTIQSVSNPLHGTVELDNFDPNGKKVIFTPTTNFNGTASFDYTITDGALTSTATVIITYNSVNDPPVASDSSITASQDTAIEITLLGSDVDADTLGYLIVTDPSHGVLGTVSNNKVTYTPNTSYTGEDSFTFKTNDETVDSNVATVSIKVNPPPVISEMLYSTPGTSSLTITWTTDHPSTSRVVYDTISHIALGVAPNYGYASSTTEADNSPKVTSHTVILSGLLPETTYYYRSISHGSPETVSTESSFTTSKETTDSNNNSSSSSSSSSSSNSTAPVCNDQKPGSAPVLLSATSGFNKVTLTWSKSLDPVSYYLVTYGTSSGSQSYGNPNVGGSSTTSYTVTGLSGDTTYYFKVRAGNGCMPGDYSNEILSTPSGGFIAGAAPGFNEDVLGEKTSLGDETAKETDSTSKNNVLGEKANKKQKMSNNYTIAGILLVLVAGSIVFYLKKKRNS